MEISKRIELARKSVLGVSIGDAFGESFFGNTEMIQIHLQLKKNPESQWQFTDDTIMSIAVLEELEQNGNINQERLIEKFCTNHDIDPNRGYGATARKILREISEGQPWKTISANVFDGQGSMGNGAAMRVCPIGAYYFDDLGKTKELAHQSAEVTHANPEAIAGAIAIAVATAIATTMQINNKNVSSLEFIEKVLDELPASETKSKIYKAKAVPYSYHIETVKSILGNGTNMTAQDTVPFVVWCAAHNLYNFEAAIWKAVSILGDRDTICAMVGGITIMSTRENYIPELWLNAVEKFELSPFRTGTKNY